MKQELRKEFDDIMLWQKFHVLNAPGDDVTGCSHCEMTFDMFASPETSSVSIPRSANTLDVGAILK